MNASNAGKNRNTWCSPKTRMVLYFGVSLRPSEGKPDLGARSGNSSTVIDIMTGQASSSHSVQVILYMYAIFGALNQYRGVTFSGRADYTDHRVDIPASAVDNSLVFNLSKLMLRPASPTPARRIPSRTKCGFSNISSVDCSERLASDTIEEGVTEDF